MGALCGYRLVNQLEETLPPDNCIISFSADLGKHPYRLKMMRLRYVYSSNMIIHLIFTGRDNVKLVCNFSVFGVVIVLI